MDEHKHKQSSQTSLNVPQTIRSAFRWVFRITCPPPTPDSLSASGSERKILSKELETCVQTEILAGIAN